MSNCRSNHMSFYKETGHSERFLEELRRYRECTGSTCAGSPVTLEYRRNSSLLAQLIGRDSIKRPVPFHRDDLISICVDGMLCALSQEPESMLLEVANQVSTPNRHQTSMAMASIRKRPTGISFPNCRYAAIISCKASVRLSRHSVRVAPSVTTSGHSTSCPM